MVQRIKEVALEILNGEMGHLGGRDFDDECSSVMPQGKVESRAIQRCCRI